jgi:serine/threonine protein phosphatase 1
MIKLQTAPACLPPGKRVYAIGDVHGCLAQLGLLHRLIAKDFAARPIDEAFLVHLGDLVDRGPASAGVVDLLASGPPLPEVPTVNLMGNHEHMMLSALVSFGGDSAETWLNNGGDESLRSWKVPSGARVAAWASYIPPRHLIFLRDLAVSHRVGPYFFVHAGVRPGVKLAYQSRHDLLWMREPFLSSPSDFGAVVVHGHTPRAEPEVRPNRIGIDTGAVMGGKLTCLMLEGDTLGFLQA